MLLVLPSGVFASSVILVPTTNTTFLTDSNIVSFDVVVDFQDTGGTLGGGLDIVFDPNALSVFGVNNAGVGDPAFFRLPDVLAGLLESWAIGQFDAISDAQTEIIGSVQFQVLPSMGADSVVSISATSGIGGPWVSGVDFLSLLSPTYNQVLLSRSDGQDIFMHGFESNPD